MPAIDLVAAALPWRVARVVAVTAETESARTIGLVVPGWAGHLAGQHIDVKLTAEDGYSAQRSYSLSRPAEGDRVEVTVQELAGGEVSPYLVGMRPGELIELRGPIGGWFVWRPTDDESRVLLVAGGSGIVPLMAMLRQRMLAGSAEFRLVYSVRTPADVYYAQELSRLARDHAWLQVTVIHTRVAAPGAGRAPGRIGAGDLVPDWRPGSDLRVYVCGPAGFVESVTTALVGQGHHPTAIRTERFGPSG